MESRRMGVKRSKKISLICNKSFFLRIEKWARGRPNSTAENAKTAEKGREGKFTDGKVMKRIANLRFEISKFAHAAETFMHSSTDEHGWGNSLRRN